MDPRFKPYAEPVSESILMAFESRLGVRLPADYRAFLLRHNGGRATGLCFAYADSGTEYEGEMRDFYPVLEGGGRTVQNDFGLCPDTFLAAEMVPIGEDQNSWRVLLAYGAAESGVYLWGGMYSENSPTPIYLASSFDEFVAGLYPEADDSPAPA